MLAAAALILAQTVTPLNDLGPAPYGWGYFGGLYEDGSNTIPADHLAGGLRRAAQRRPADAVGQPPGLCRPARHGHVLPRVP